MAKTQSKAEREGFPIRYGFDDETELYVESGSRFRNRLQGLCSEKRYLPRLDGVELTARMQVLTISPEELQQELQSPSAPKLLDVREDDELAICKLAYDYHIPLGALLDRVGELNPEEDLVVYCRSGARSANAAAFLAKRGFKRVRNLESGINGWSRTVDPSVPLY